MNRDDLFGVRTDKERAADYLHRVRPARPKAPARTEDMFPELGPERRALVPLPPPPEDLFPEPECQGRKLVPVDGWPDYRAAERSVG